MPGLTFAATASSVHRFAATSAVRLAEASEAVRESVPGAVVPVFEAATRLGNPALLTVALAVLYWTARRRETAAVVGYGFVGFAVVLALKAAFAMPRPPEAVWAIATDGYGFPSGHAVGGVVVYGGIAAEFDWLDDHRKAAATAVVVGAIALSRVVLGVHYLGDVVAGLAVGAVVLLGARQLTGGEPFRAYALGTAVAFPAIWVTGASVETLEILAACLGGLVAGRYFHVVPERQSRAEAVLLVVLGIPMVVAVQVLAASDPPVLAAVDNFVLLAAVLLLPAALDRIDAVERVSVGTGG